MVLTNVWISESQWYHGKGRIYSALLVGSRAPLADRGKMCCLGFVASQVYNREQSILCDQPMPPRGSGSWWACDRAYVGLEEYVVREEIITTTETLSTVNDDQYADEAWQKYRLARLAIGLGFRFIFIP